MTQIGAPASTQINIGIEANPPFAVLPEPATLFQKRAVRLRTLAPKHPIEGYLSFVASICDVQHKIQPGLPKVELPSAERLELARTGTMPPLSSDDVVSGAPFKATLQALLAAILDAGDAIPVEAKDAARRIIAMTDADRDEAIENARTNGDPGAAVGEHVLIAAALQVHFARLAAELGADTLQAVADGVCPACGSAPVSTSVVGWPVAPNTRYCTCSLCQTHWNYVRVKCVRCGSTGGIAYRAIEGEPETVKGEVCGACNSYVKILYQVNDPALEPVADDIASLGLDLKLGEQRYARGGVNPFLTGITGAADQPPEPNGLPEPAPSEA